MFAFRTECCSDSQRNAVRLHSGIAFAFDRIPQAVLIADDNDSVRRALCEAFAREADFEVCAEADDGRDSVEKALRLRPDLIVLDLSMPVMNGLDAARELKGRMPSVPIIFFTFHVDLFVKEAALPAGVSDVVSKSEDVSVLITKARSLLYQNAG